MGTVKGNQVLTEDRGAEGGHRRVTGYWVRGAGWPEEQEDVGCLGAHRGAAGQAKGNTGGLWEYGVQRVYERGAGGCRGTVARGAKQHRWGIGVPWLGCREGTQWGAGVLQLGCRGTIVRVVGSAGYVGRDPRVLWLGAGQTRGRMPSLGGQGAGYRG